MTPRRFTSVVFLLLCIALASVSSQPQAQTRAADPVNEGGTTVSSMIGIEDVFDPTDVDIYRDLAGGVTTANVLHGSANPIGGKNYVVTLRWGKPRTEEFAFEGAMPGIKFALGENPKRPGGGAGGRQGTGPARYPATRMGVEYVIRDAFTRAKAYQHEWQEWDRRRKAGDTLVAPRRDLQLEPLVEILEGKRLVHAHSYRADEILMLLRVADEFGFKIATLQHVLEGYIDCDVDAREFRAHPPEHRLWGGLEPLTDQSLAAIRFSSSP